MKKITITSIALLLASTMATAQTAFQETIGGSVVDNGFGCAQQTTDGGYVVFGETYSFGAGWADVYLVKVTAEGELSWAKTFGGADYDTGGWGQQTGDGGYIIIATSTSFIEGKNLLYVVKTDSSGTLTWAKYFLGDIESWNSRAATIQQTNDDGYIIASVTDEYGMGASDIYLIRLDSTGNVIWAKTYGAYNEDVEDVAQYVRQTTDGGFVVAGSRSVNGLLSLLIIRTDSSGNVLWSKQYGDGLAMCIQLTKEGGFIVTGSGSNSFYVQGMLLLKLDENGNETWSKIYSGDAAFFERAFFVEQTLDNGYILTGQTAAGNGENNIFLIKTDEYGDTTFTRLYGGLNFNQAYSVHEVTDKGYLISGLSTSFNGQHMYLIKTDPSGNSGCNQEEIVMTVNDVSFYATDAGLDTTILSLTAYDAATQISEGGEVQSLCLSVGIGQAEIDNSFIIYPNPSKGEFTIKITKELRNVHADIFNNLGERIQSKEFTSEEMNLNALPGIYFVRVSNGETSYNQKLIIQ